MGYTPFVALLAALAIMATRCSPHPRIDRQEDEKAKQDSISQECRNHGGRPVKELDGVRVFCDYK